MLFRRRQTPPPRAHLQVHVDRKRGEVRGVSILSALHEDEAATVLAATVAALRPYVEPARRRALTALIDEEHSRASLLDKIRGRAQRWQDQARQTLPRERFTGLSDGVRVVVTGNLEIETVDLLARPPAALLESFWRAFVQAESLARTRWRDVLHGAIDEPTGLRSAPMPALAPGRAPSENLADPTPSDENAS